MASPLTTNRAAHSERLIANLVGRVRQVTEGGREYLVAPLTLIVPAF